MKSYTAKITPHKHLFLLHAVYTDTAQLTRAEGWSAHPTVEDALSFLDALCVRLGASLTLVEVADADVLAGA